MHEGGFGFDLIRRVVRAIPDRLPGKTRLARRNFCCLSVTVCFASRAPVDQRTARAPVIMGSTMILALPPVRRPGT
jgi:hypothetical protein